MQMQQALSQPQSIEPQPQSTPVDESQSSPIKVSRKNKGKIKISTKEAAPADKPEKSNRIKWPPGDEVLLTKGYIYVSEDPIIDNNQNNAQYWGRIADYYNGERPEVPRIAHNLRSHWHHIKTKVNRFNDLYLQAKSRYKSGWSDDQYIHEAKLEYINDPSNKSSNPFTYEHVWRVIKDRPKYDSSTKVHGHQALKRQKSNSTGEYTISMGEYTGSTNTPEFGISLDDDDDDIQAEQEPPSRPMGRDKAKSMGRDNAKSKGKATCSSDYEAKKLSLVE
ncbi:hypothetical protein L1987_10799 [Smallanthus sonchifolius]|uniref:Uncharacterized protein n=1 Tax=Smallanthus sonchifolius TaxID=185202 RepID=A0ACB9J9I9_9ASTR|nr:hypothetical protein L1987_10799 [Smallanthus sonchifolius]